MFHDLFESKEEFSLLELSPRKTVERILRIDDEKRATLSSARERFSIARFAGKRQVIAAADSALAVSFETPFTLRRDRDAAERPLQTIELDNFLSQFIDRSFGALRRNAAAIFKTDEIDTILVGVKAKHFRVNGHAVFNPTGFSGATLEAVLDFTFTTRGVFDAFKDQFNAADPSTHSGQAGFFFTSLQRSLLNTIFRLEPTAGFLALRPESSLFFWRDPVSGLIRERRLAWSFADLLEAIALKVPLEDGYEADRFLGGSIRSTDPAILPLVTRFMRPLARELANASRAKMIYVRPSEPLPFLLPRKEGKITFYRLPLVSALEKFGFHLNNPPASDEIDARFIELAPFFEFHQDRGSSEVNHALRRKIHWLAK